MGRHIPAEVRRELRREANFGCAICGTPILEYHHIIPYSEKEHHDPDHMIALCPNHHRPSDDQAISKERLYELKENPENDSEVGSTFHPQSQEPVIRLADLDVRIEPDTTCSVLTIGETDIFSITYRDGRLLFDLEFYNDEGEVIAKVTNNDWWAEANDVWDIVFKSKELKIWNSERDLGLNVSYDDSSDMYSFRFKIKYNSKVFEVYPSSIQAPGDRTIKGSGTIHMARDTGGVVLYMDEDMKDMKMLASWEDIV